MHGKALVVANGRDGLGTKSVHAGMHMLPSGPTHHTRDMSKLLRKHAGQTPNIVYRETGTVIEIGCPKQFQ